MARPETVELHSVPGFIVFDLPGAPVSAGGTRLAPDVTAAEVAMLARAMTYKFAALGADVGGAKAGVVGDPGDRADRAARMARYCEEIRPLVASGRFLTGGSGWDGRSAAIEGFGKVGGGVAREVARRGGRVVAISTVSGSIRAPAGLDVEHLLALRRIHGDDCIAHYGLTVGSPAELFAAEADVLVPGARPGAISGPVAESLAPAVRVIAPAANVPYTRHGADVLRSREIAALPDFVCNAGAVIGYRSAIDATPDEVLATAAGTITELIQDAMSHVDGPLTGACERAAAYLRSWLGEPPEPPFAG